MNIVDLYSIVLECKALQYIAQGDSIMFDVYCVTFDCRAVLF